jgi:uncharacterized membrane protein YczE
MTRLASREVSTRVVRTGLELIVLAAGFALGGTVGIDTLLYALPIGPVAHISIPLTTVPAATPSHLGG